MRGCEKKIYYIKNPSSAYFEEAVFVLRAAEDGADARPAACATLAEEAERIIREASPVFAAHETGRQAPVRRMPSPLAFALGAVCSSSVIGAIALIAALA